MLVCLFFFFNDTATTEIYTLSLHDALPILAMMSLKPSFSPPSRFSSGTKTSSKAISAVSPACQPIFSSFELVTRSEEHTSELQSRQYLVCRLLLEKKKQEKQSVHSCTFSFT